jgi:hypothetical protein
MNSPSKIQIDLEPKKVPCTHMSTFHPRQEANAIVRPELETALKDEAIGLLGELSIANSDHNKD